MKHTAIKKLLILAMVSCLLFGMVGTVFAEEAQESELNQLLSDVQELMRKYGPEIPEEVKKGTWKGTSRYYETEGSSLYVAIGENSIRNNKESYADLLKAERKLASCDKLAQNDLLVEQIPEKILANSDYAAKIADADLITLNLSINSFARMAIDEVLDKTNTYLDWSRYVPAEGVAEIKKTLSDLKSYLVASGVSGSILTLGSKADALVTAAESFAFGTLAYANTLPLVLDEIHEMNPDAMIVVVGMDNPLSGSTISLSTGESMGLGNYVAKLVEFTDQCAQTAAIDREYVVFTAASGAENANDGAQLTENKLILSYLSAVKAEALPTKDGHAYIKDQIQAAFRKMGDVDGDREVTYNDALLTLRASIGLDTLDRDGLIVGDVDGDGEPSYNDALMILRASIGLGSLG